MEKAFLDLSPEERGAVISYGVALRLSHMKKRKGTGLRWTVFMTVGPQEIRVIDKVLLEMNVRSLCCMICKVSA